jgi:hypothetical protein
MIGTLLRLLFRGINEAKKEDPQAYADYYGEFETYEKEFFDNNYPCKFYRHPIQNLGNDIAYYHSQIGTIFLTNQAKTTMFKICETKILSDKELAMNVELVYVDVEQTGIVSKRLVKVKQNHFFILFINDELNQLEIKSDLQTSLTDKNFKNDFGEFLVKYLLKSKKETEEAAKLNN